ncbi:Carboxylesterase NlhH [bacterium YEK0313]|nr:Carboxylesterase NlhH [bacterium YEK0313]
MTVTTTDHIIETGTPERVRARVYRNDAALRAAPLVLHLHGGAFVNGSLEEGAPIAGLLAEAGAVVVSIEYPLAPLKTFPGPLQSAYQSLAHVYKNRTVFAGKASPLYVAGEEAGGNLAAALALMARDQQTPPLAGQILLSPMVDACLATRSIREAEAGPVGCRWADGWHSYLGSADKASHPYAAPGGATRLGDVPPALVLTAEDDPMRDESLRYADQLEHCGVAVTREVLAGPTGWPCILCGCGNLSAPWVEETRRQFASFFAETAGRRMATPSLQPVRA